MRRAAAVMNGAAAAVGGEVPLSIFHAMTDTPEEAKAIYNEYQARKSARQAKDSD